MVHVTVNGAYMHFVLREKHNMKCECECEPVFSLGVYQKAQFPLEVSNVPFGGGLKTTLCSLVCSNYMNYLKVLSRLEK